MLLDIRPDQLQMVLAILQKHVAQYEVWGFGSRAKWTAKDYSDLDLCVVSDKPLSFSLLGALAEDFSDSDLPWKVDVVDWATTSESFRKIIKRDKVVVQTGSVAIEWKETVLGELIKTGNAHLQTGPFGTALKAAEYSAEGVPLISVGEVRQGYFEVSDKTPRISEETTKRLPQFILETGDIVFGRKGGIDRNAIIQPQQRGWFLGSDGIRLRLSKKYNSLFFSYQMRSPSTRAWLLQHCEGTTMPSLNQQILGRVPIVLPPLSEQKAIAHILGTLDDKIELNRRMNETLEAIAQALFKSWFVDFEPVRAKMSGEPSASICQRLGLTPELLALFPERLVDSELGEVPDGWEVKPLDEIADYLNGLALQKFPPESDLDYLPVIKIAQLKKGDTLGADRASCKLKPEYIVNDGDVLFSWSGSLAVDVWCGGPGALNQHLFKVTSADYPKWLYLYWTKHHLAHFQAIAAGKAVTMGHIQRKHLTEALCVMPPPDLVKLLDGVMSPFLATQIENRKGTRTLSILRDTLLPKLLSGELRVLIEGEA